MFKQNYLNELPDDIQDKIYMMVNKNKFNDCLCDIDNNKLKKFHLMYDLIKDDWFGISLELYGDIINQGLSWFNHAYGEPVDADSDLDYEVFDRDRCLNWKNYTTPKPEYQKIKCVRFGYCNENNKKFNRGELTFINTHIKEHISSFDGDICASKITFKNNYIDVYFHKLYTKDGNQTATDIIYNIYWGYKMIDECLKHTSNSGEDLNYDIDLHYVISWFDNHSFLECFKIEKGIVEPFFGS